MTTVASSVITSPFFKETDSNGNPLAGGQLFTYQAGTNVPQATYTDATLTVPNPNPIILDAYGKAEIWMGSATYKINLLDVHGVQQPDYPVDNLQTPNFSSGSAASVLAELAATGPNAGATLVGAQSLGTSSSPTTVAKKLAESISVLDFGADPTGANDSTAAFNAAIAYGISLGAGTFGSNNSTGAGCQIVTGCHGATFLIKVPIVVPSGFEIDMQGNRLTGNNYTNNCFQSGYVYNGVATSNDIDSCSFTASTVNGSNIVTVSTPPTGSPLVAGAIIYGPGIPYQASFNTFGSGSTTGNGGTGTYQLSLPASSTNTSQAYTAGMQSLAVGIQIKNAVFTNFNRAISITGCVDLCSFTDCTYYDCIYSLWAYNCFYVTYKNHMTRTSGTGAWLLATTTYTNGAYHFDSFVNQCEMDSMFVVGRVLGFEFYNYVDGTQIRTCSVESCTNGMYFGGEVDLLDIHNCYFENITGTVLNFSSGYPHGSVTIDNNWFNSCTGTIINGVQMGAGSTWGRGNHYTTSSTGTLYFAADQSYNYMDITVPDMVGADTQYGILTASVSGNILTVTAIPSGGTPVAPGSTINGVGIPVNTYILPFSASGTTGTGGTGNYVLSTTPGTVASANIGIGPAPLLNNITGPQFNFGTGNIKQNVHGRNTTYSSVTGLSEVAANGAILTSNPIPYNFYGTSGYVTGAIPYCTQYTLVQGTGGVTSTITIVTKMVYDPYVMGRFALKVTTNLNTYQLVGHFSGPNVTLDVANGFTVTLGSANGYVVLTITSFPSGTTTVSGAEGIVRLT